MLDSLNQFLAKKFRRYDTNKKYNQQRQDRFNQLFSSVIAVQEFEQRVSNHLSVDHVLYDLRYYEASKNIVIELADNWTSGGI